ncbi:hypothetical protein ACFWCB_26185 [Streptomyces sp. NPDC060048]|uniref:hypothetical protein n=1 Tax=unclassified Streptomyces TaxID=2593676 RepID=UPI0036A6E944
MATLAARAETLRPAGLTPLLTTEQLMALYGVSNWTLNEWVKRGCPVEPTPFRGRRFDLQHVQTWIAHEARMAETDRESAPPAPKATSTRSQRATAA